MPFTVRCVHVVHGDRCFTRPAIHVWCKKFAYDGESVDEEGSCRCVVSMTDATITAVDFLMQSDRHVMG